MVRRRRGAAAIEFALTTTALLFLMFAIVDWGWLLFEDANVETAVASAARTGALSSTPTATATAAVQSQLRSYGIDPSGATIHASVSGVSPYRQLDVAVEVPYVPPVPLAGLPVPPSIHSTATAHLEAQ